MLVRLDVMNDTVDTVRGVYNVVCTGNKEAEIGLFPRDGSRPISILSVKKREQRRFEVLENGSWCN